MQLSRFFLVSLVAALSAIVVASAESSVDAGLVAKRAALESRMHARAHAGHGALKKRQQISEAQLEGKERIRRAQHKPTKTNVAAPGLEKRQFGTTYGTLGGLLDGVTCVCPGGFCPPGCSVPKQNQPKPSAVTCTGSAFSGCSQTGLGGSVGGPLGSSSAGISNCCQSGYTCQKVDGLVVSVCLNFVQAFDLGRALVGQSFGTQTESINFLNGYKASYFS